ncbi:MAG: tetratricopeptide repeat protein [Candidatus Sericytochromatia bacterium]
MSLVVLAKRFELHSELGQGGFATTWRAKDRKNGRWCALKALNLQALEDWKSLELFERESKLLINLQHPHIPRCFESLTLEENGQKQYYQVHELIEAENLEKQIRNGRFLTEKEVLQIGIQLLDVLGYLHGFSPPIIHRDIKPGNILLTAAHSAYLIDFGAVKETLLRKEGTPTVVGTFGYMPIEQMEGHAVPVSDIYALGMSLIFLLSHREPDEFEKKGLKIQFRPHVNISGEFAKLLERMVEPDPDKRPTSASELKQAFEKLVSRQSITQTPTSAPRPNNRMPAFVAAGLALMVLGILGLREMRQPPAAVLPSASPPVAATARPGSAQDARSQANSYYDAEQYALAEVYFDKALQSTPNDAELLFRRGFCRGKSAKHAQAIADYKRVLTLAAASYPLSHYNIAWNYAQMNYHQAAIKAFGQMLALQPKHVDSINNRGLSYIQVKAYDKALADFNATIALKPDYKYPYNNLGEVYRLQGKAEEALAAFDKAMRLFPTYALPAYNKADILGEQKRYPEAIEALNQAIQSSPEYVSAYNLRGLCQYNQKNYDLAIADYLEAIRLSPKYATAWYNLGLAYDDKGDGSKAEEYYNKALEFSPKYASPLNNLGYLYERRKNYPQALSYYNQAIANEPTKGLYFRNRGDIYKALKQCSPAQSDWQKACTLGLNSACKKSCP